MARPSSRALIELTERTVGIWFMQIDATTDWMAHMDQTDTHWQLTYRFRYYKGDQALKFEESEDEKSWTRMVAEKANVTRKEFLERVDFVIVELMKATGNEPDVVFMGDGGIAEFTKELAAKPWTQVETRTYH